MSVAVNRQPIDGVSTFILPIRVSLVMLHMDRVVHGLRKTAGDGLCDSKQPIEQSQAEERVVNEIVPHPVDVRVDHQRIKKPEKQHRPQRRVRKHKIQAKKISEMEKTRGRRDSVPARVREEL